MKLISFLFAHENRDKMLFPDIKKNAFYHVYQKR